jgi:NAD(P)-dependent dehydrogenase (short-subunit alcohol dehydrogenase family)
MVVTGCASGIGRAVRARLEAGGHTVVGVDLHDAEVCADLSEPGGRAQAVEGARRLVDGPLDAVVACAGVADPDDLAVRVNYFGMVAVLEGLRESLAAADGANAVALSSCALTMVEADHPVTVACLAGDEARAVELALAEAGSGYPGSKRALAHWVRRHAGTPDWIGSGISMNAVAPGIVLTPMTEGNLTDPAVRPLMFQYVPMPIGRIAQPEELAAVITFLASPEASMIVGQTVFVDGGSDASLRPDVLA